MNQAPQFSAAAQPKLQRRKNAPQDEAVGLQLRGQTCRPDNNKLGLKKALAFVAFPSKSSRLCGCTANKHPTTLSLELPNSG